MNKSQTIREWALARVGDPYIFAASGQKCTPEFRAKQEAAKPAYAANIKKYCPVRSGKQATCDGCKYKDRPAHDCSGLTKEAAALIGIKLPHGASSQWKGDYWDVKGPIAQMPLDKVCFVFNDKPDADPMGHVGIYQGDGTVVDARGHAYGVMHTKLGSYAWDHYGVLKGMLHEEGGIAVPDVQPSTPDAGLPTLRKGAKGTYVKAMQNLLIAKGFTLPVYGADGDFGKETLQALKDFQAASGITVDGITGPLTWSELLENGPEDTPDPEPEIVLCSVTLVNVPEAEADALVAKYPGSTKAVG
jgi:hypothetical protein